MANGVSQRRTLYRPKAKIVPVGIRTEEETRAYWNECARRAGVALNRWIIEACNHRAESEASEPLAS